MSFSEIPDVLDESVVEGLLRGTPMALEPALTAFVLEVRQLQHDAAPAPSAALASLLTHGFGVPPGAALAPVRNRWRRRAAGVAGLCAALSVSLVSAAAAQALPPSAQHVVAGIVDRVTPFTVPDPPAHPKSPRPKQHVVVAPTRSATSAPVPAPSVARPTSVPQSPAATTHPPTVQHPAAPTPAPTPAPPVHRVVPPLPARPTSRGQDDGAKPRPTAGDGSRAHEPSPRAPRPSETAGAQNGRSSGGGDHRSGRGKEPGRGGKSGGRAGDGGGGRNGRGSRGDG